MTSRQEARRTERTRKLTRDQHGLEFIGAIAHDLRGPLATITTSAELLEEETDKTTSDHLVSVIQRQAQRIQMMIQDLSEFVGLESGVVLMHPGVVNLNALVTGACAEFQEFESSHRLHVDMPAKGIRIRADADKLRRVLENLLRNAFKYSPAGSEVVVRLRQQDDDVVIEVDDEGCGVPEEERERIFEPFVRLNRNHCAGQGLGLHIVRLLAHAHHGRAWVESSGKGARFCVAIPVVAVLTEPELCEPTPLLPYGTSRE